MTAPEATVDGTILSGHKEDAIELPFDPSLRWGCAPERFAPGRKGVAVHARVGTVEFESQVVRRAGRHWLLLPSEAMREAGLRAGDAASIVVRRSTRS